MRLAGLAVALLQLAATASAATLDSLIEEYGRLYRSPAGSIERLYDLSWAITDSLLLSDRFETMDYSTLRPILPGMIEVSGDLVTVSPDVPTFLALARRHGDSVDVDFFETRSALDETNIWPKYILQQTDESGCMRFGSGAVVDAYSAWVEFTRKHPGRYDRWAKGRAKQALDDLTGNTCVCGDRHSAIRELELFLARFPSGPASKSVRKRLRDLRSGAGVLREHCIAG